MSPTIPMKKHHASLCRFSMAGLFLVAGMPLLTLTSVADDPILAISPSLVLSTASENPGPTPPEPPKKPCKDDLEKCIFCPTENKCVDVRINFGQSLHDPVFTVIQLFINRERPTPTLFTPQGLGYTLTLSNARVSQVTTSGLPAGIARQVTIISDVNDYWTYRFPTGYAVALPIDRNIGSGKRLYMLDVNGAPVTDNPAYYEEISSDGSRLRYSVATLRPASQTLASGRQVTTADLGIEIIRDTNQFLRQIWSATDGLADIVVTDIQKYEIRLYNPENVGSKDTNGLYTVSGTPRATWVIENPSGVYEQQNTVRMTENVNGVSYVYDWAYTSAADDWSLTEGGGLRKTTKTRVTTSNGTIYTTNVLDANNSIVYSEQETWHIYNWGYALQSKVIDPEGLALTSSNMYYENISDACRYGRLKAELRPDGSWTVYDYDEQGRKSLEITPWKDSAFGSTAAQAKAVAYAYTPVDTADTLELNDQRPRTVMESILGVATKKTFHVYKTVNGEHVEIEERAATPVAAYGASGNLRTTTTYYAATAGTVAAYRLKSLLRPDGTLDSYSYELGNYTVNADPALNAFTPATGGGALRTTVVHGTSASPDGIALKSTKEVAVEDERNNTVLDETYVYTSSGYERIIWTAKTYDSQHHVTATYNSDATQTAATWSCCNKQSETLADGTEYTYTYDLLKRVTSKAKAAANGQTALVTSYTYDAKNHVLSETVTGGSLSLGATKEYDRADRITRQTDVAGLTTVTSYTDSGRTETVTLPGGATRITAHYLEGTTKSVTGTGVVANFADKGVNTDGTVWETSYTAAANSPSYQKTTSNTLGQLVKIEEPSFNSGLSFQLMTYNAAGQLIKTEQRDGNNQPIIAPTLNEYDSLGDPFRTGLDVNGNDVLGLSSNDRIQETETDFEKDSNNAWWRVVTSRTYATTNSASSTVMSIQKRRLTGLGSALPSSYQQLAQTSEPVNSLLIGLTAPVLTAETQTTDATGNITYQQIYTDRATKTVLAGILSPGADLPTGSATRNGLTIMDVGIAAVTTQYQYDALGRRTGVTDPRTGTAVTHYNALGQVDYTENAAGNRISYTYDSVTSRRTAVTDPLNHTVYTAYDLLGHKIGEWGATYPVFYEYDAYGRMTGLYTLRNPNISIASYADFVTNQSAFDKTTWVYDAASGLLDRKLYADNQGPSYTYDALGRLITRTWARTFIPEGETTPQPLITEYGYDAATGELTNINYADATPDVVFTYTRTGKKATVTDAAGTHTFTYTAAQQEVTEHIEGDLYDKLISRQHDPYGRAAGFQVGTTADPDADYAVGYGYDAHGRFNSVATTVPSVASATYTYLANSNLIEKVTFPNNITETKAYEANRDFVTAVTNSAGMTLFSRYTCTNDAVGQRTVRVQEGAVFTATDTIAFGYNSRSEVTSGVATNDSNYSFCYSYDPIGNRLTYTVTSGTPTMYTSNILNQLTVTTSPAETFIYDADGNLTNDGTFSYTWDAENRLIKVENEQINIRNDYDYKFRRVKKQSYAWRDGSWLPTITKFFLYENRNLLLEFTNNENVISAYSYIWGLDLFGTMEYSSGIGGLLFAVRDNDLFYYTYDVNGNVSECINAVDGDISHYEYAPFGMITRIIGQYATDNPFGFSTKYNDNEINLAYYGYRFYNYSTGRWINRDPNGELETLNLYEFVNNYPIGNIDIDGLFTRSQCQSLVSSAISKNKKIKK